MSRNAYEDYMNLTGHLPVIKRDMAVCWKGEQLYIGGDACYEGAPKYLSAAETREYMVKRFGYRANELGYKTFDPKLEKEVLAEEVRGVTITEAGVLKNFSKAPDIKVQEGIEMGYVDGDVDQDVPGAGSGSGGLKMKLGGFGFVAIAVIVALGYMLIAGRK